LSALVFTQVRLSFVKAKELVDEVWQIIDHQYVDGTFNQVDWQTVRKQYLSRSYTSKGRL